jgi:hypothetical protein
MASRRTITSDDFKVILETGRLANPERQYLNPEGNEIVIENIVVEGEVILDDLRLGASSIIVREVNFSLLRFAHSQIKQIRFDQCTIKVLTVVGDSLPKKLNDTQLGILRLEEYRGPTAVLRKWIADGIIVANTNISNELADDLRPRHTLKFNACTLSGVTLQRNPEYSDFVLDKLEFSGGNVAQGLIISGWKVEWIRFWDVPLDHTFVRLEFCQVSHLHLNGLHAEQAYVSFKNVTFVEANTRAANEDSVTSSRPSVLILESKIQELKWSFCDWSKVRMKIGDIVIGKVKLQGSTTPRNIVPTNDQWKEVSDLFGLFESYARSQGHTADAITNKAKALRAYRFYLDKQGRDWVDRITLRLSECISDYGSNWLRALGVLLGTGLFLFVFVLWVSDNRISLGHIDFSTPSLALKYTSYFLEFLSPFHKSTFLDIELNPVSKLVDAVSRIWMGFVIYHLVRSTRKFVS